MNIIFKIIFMFVLLYPVIMSFVWIFGGVLYALKAKRDKKKFITPSSQMPFTVLVPVFNEEDHIEELLRSNIERVTKYYDNVMFWVINDCSTDDTKEILEKFEEGKHLKITNLDKNLGKAGVLNYSLDHIDTDYFICVDSDTMIKKDALVVLNEIINNENDETVAAYTGSVSINTMHDRNSVLKIQRLEYRSIIGSIKRTQDFFFKNLMTVSGALTCYKVKILQAVGGFNETNATEDVEITWRLANNGYRSRFISKFCAKIFSPEIGYSLLKQRIRWSLGSIQTAKTYYKDILRKGSLASRVFLIDRYISILWVYSFVGVTILIFSKLFFGFPEKASVETYLFPTMLLLITSIIFQFVSYILEKGDKEHFDEFMTLIFYYPLVYWLIQPAGYIASVISFKTKEEDSGHWRTHEKHNIRIRSLHSTLFDIALFLFAIFFWRTILETVIVYVPKDIVSIYYLLMTYWIGVGLLFYVYFIRVRHNTLGENLFGLMSNRRRNFVQAIVNPVTVIMMVNTIISSSNTILLLEQTDYNVALEYIGNITKDATIVSESLYPWFVVVLIDSFFGISKKLINNKMKMMD